MALFDIGGSRIQLLGIRDGKIYNLVVKDGITLTREPNNASKLTCSIKRDSYCPDVGDGIKMTLDGAHHCFMGFVIDVNLSHEWADITCYDQIYYLSESKTRMVYQDLTANEVLERICKDADMGMLDPPTFEGTNYKIPYRIEDNVSYLDIICTALDLTFENTGKRFYIWDDAGSMCLTSAEWLANTTSNIYFMSMFEDYNISKSLNTDYFTAVRLEEVITQDTETAGERKTYLKRNETAIKKYGYKEHHDTIQEGENGDAKAQEILDSQGTAIRESLTINGAQGDIVVKGGTPVLVDFYTVDRKELIRGWYTVESVTHHFDSRHHTMDMSLKLYGNMMDNWDVVDIQRAYLP